MHEIIFKVRCLHTVPTGNFNTSDDYRMPLSGLFTEMCHVDLITIYIILINHACATFEQRIVDRFNDVLKMFLVLENTRG